ncbi:MAG: hypothetical protein GY842_19845, partial [bacterium]|nr:hypothetical protein [bacterium]
MDDFDLAILNPFSPQPLYVFGQQFFAMGLGFFDGPKFEYPARELPGVKPRARLPEFANSFEIGGIGLI